MTDSKWLLDRAEIERLPDEPDEAWYRRVQEAVRAAADPGILALWRERAHALVRAGFRQTNRTHRWICLVLVAVALTVFGSLVVMKWAGEPSGEEETAGWFVCLWPLIVVLGAGLLAAGAVTAERERDTALQLVLTTVPRRTIAAARVLPAVRPFLWGMLGALPVYIWAAHLGEFPLWPGQTPWVMFLPLRILVVPADNSFVNELGPEYPFGPALELVGSFFVWLTDLGLVWAAAHWGAAYAVRLGRLWLAALYLAGRLVRAGLWLAICTALAIMGGWLPFALLEFLRGMPQPGSIWFRAASFGKPMFWPGVELALGLAISLPLFVFLCRRVIIAAVRMALEEFAWFDRLADDEFEPRLREAKPWAIPLAPRARL